MNIATLTIEMAANVARLREEMSAAVGIVKDSSAQIKKYAELAEKALGLLGIGLTAKALLNFARNVIDAADALDEMSGRIGVSAKELSGLQLAYKQAGMGNEAMASSLAKLSREMSEGNAGLRALGVNTRNADGSLRGTTAVLLDVADKFTGMQDGATKTALAMEIFGKSGAEMVPLLNGGAEGISQMTAMAEKLGLVIEDGVAKQAGDFNDTLELLGLGMQGIGTRIAAQLLPTLNSLAGSFLESMTSGDRLRGVADFLAASLKILYSIGVGIIEVFSTVGKTLGAAAGQLAAILRGDFALARSIGQEWKRDVASGWESSGKAINAAWSEQAGAVVQAGASIIKTNKDLLAAEKAREEAAKKAAAAAAKAAEEAKKRAEDGAKLAASLLAQDTGLAGDFAEKWDKLNTAHTAGKLGLEQLTMAQKALLDQQPFMKKAYDEAVKASQAAAEARRKEADGIDAFMRAQEEAAAASLKSVKDRISSLQDEERAADLSRTLNISLAEAVERVAIARLQEQQAGFYAGSEGWERIRREIEEREKLLGLLGKKDTREREERGWTDMWQSVDRTAHDVFTNIWDGGSNVFKKLGQTLKASVLDVLYQMTVRRWVINIGTSIFGAGFGAAAQAATGGSSALGTIGSIGSGYSLLSALGGTFGGGVAAGWGGLLGSAGLSATGATLGGALDAGAIALRSGNILGGLGTFAGALGPIALGIGLLSSLFGKGKTPHLGGGASYSAADGLVTGPDSRNFLQEWTIPESAYRDDANQAAGTIAQSIAQMLDATATAFGKDAGYTVGTGFADDSSRDGAWGSLRIVRGNNSVVDWGNPDGDKWAGVTFADGEQGQKEYAAALAKSAREALVNAIGEGNWASDMLAALGSSPTLDGLEQAVAQINAAQAVFVEFGRYMPEFSALAEDAVSQLVKASGGAQALTANMSSFVGNYFSEAERMADLRGQLQNTLSGLGLSIDPNLGEEAKTQFRAAVQGALAAGNSELAASLLAINGNFATAANYFEQSVQGAADAAAQAAKTLADSTYDLFRRALTRDRDALNDQASTLQDTIGSITDAVGLLRSNARELLGTVDSTAQMLAAQGMVYIEDALAGVRAGASVTDYAGLSDAISAARGGIDQGTYRNDAERGYDALVLAGQLSELGDLGDAQLSFEERQLAAVNQQLDYLARLDKRADALVNGNVELTDTVDGYFQQLLALYAPKDAEDAGPGGKGGAGSGAVFGGGGVGGASTRSDKYFQPHAYGTDIYYAGVSANQEQRLDNYYTGYHAFDGTGNADGLNSWIAENKLTPEDLSGLSGLFESDWERWFNLYDLPQFATGAAFTNSVVSRPTMFDMGLMGERGSEAILPLTNVGGRLGVYASGADGGSAALIAELVGEVRALRAQVAELTANAADSASSSAATASVLTRVTRNGEGMIVTEAPL